MYEWMIVHNLIIFNSFCLNTELIMVTYGIWLISILCFKTFLYSLFHQQKYLSIFLRLILSSIIFAVCAPVYGKFLWSDGGVIFSFLAFLLYAYLITKKMKIVYPNNMIIKKHSNLEHLSTYVLFFLAIIYLIGYYVTIQPVYSNYIRNPITITGILFCVLLYFGILWAFGSLVEWYFLASTGISMRRIFAVNVPIYAILLLYEINRVYIVIVTKDWSGVSYCISK